MLPAGVRLTKSRDFRRVLRRGRRAGRARLVLHVLDAAPDARRDTRARPAGTADRAGMLSDHPRVGFVVSKAVGIAVVRHRVTRRLRHLMRDRMAALPAGTLVVVRALPPAAGASSHDLAADLDAAYRRLGLLSRGDKPSDSV